MKVLGILVLMLGLVACGSDPATEEAAFEASTEEVMEKQSMSLAVEESDLHDCNEAVLNQLVYLTDRLEFVTCTADGWETIEMKNPQSVIKTEQIVADASNAFCKAGGLEVHSGLDDNLNGVLDDAEIKDTQRVCNGEAGQNGTNGTNGTNGVDGTNGLSIVSNKSLGAINTDYCTYYNNEACYFEGGQLVVYSDGSFEITAHWRFQYAVVGDTDVDNITRTFKISGDNDIGSISLHNLVARSGSAVYKSVGLVFTADAVDLVFDSDNDGIDFDDTVLSSVTLSDW